MREEGCIVVPHKSLDLQLFRKEGLLFQDWIAHQGLAKLVKGVNIKIDDDVWLSFTGLKGEGYKSHVHDFHVNKWKKWKEIYKDCLRYPRGHRVNKLYKHDGMKREEKCVLLYLLGYYYQGDIYMIV
ncbi:uncharacterized protein HKW66_Vig0113960 [Vigna angularis]|uniref:Uncharacterized protein n=1 Tax=Phaseolus angularis TaxID=3914 RepID=A0A8T0KXR4_PHAAN|nr:uncharacterized protein HKW66_Vig0113960 [Vigna angularis]